MRPTGRLSHRRRNITMRNHTLGHAYYYAWLRGRPPGLRAYFYPGLPGQLRMAGETGRGYTEDAVVEPRTKGGTIMRTRDRALGAGIGVAALAAAGGYFLYGARGARNRARIAGWALQMKGEVLERMEKLKDLNQQRYDDLVERTAQRYGRMKRVSAAELGHLTGELKSAWTHIGKQLK